MLVTVKGNRFTPFFQIGLRRLEIIERVLGRRKAQVQQLASRIVDIDEQGAFWRASGSARRR